MHIFICNEETRLENPYENINDNSHPWISIHQVGKEFTHISLIHKW